MGVVYAASRMVDGSRVAIKTIRPAVAASPHEVQRFLREAAILGELRHPHIVPFLESGQACELLYFVMEYVAGTDASRIITAEGPMPPGRAVRLLCQALEALHYAHQAGFVHRDVKPANLLLSGAPGAEICKLADFGLARAYHASPMSGLTMMGDVGGTIPYMPPEQITNYREAKPPADQYAAAATLYYLLTACHVFDFKDVPSQSRLAMVLCDDPVPVGKRRAGIPKGLAKAIHRALEKDPQRRFADAAAFRDALLPFGEDHSGR